MQKVDVLGLPLRARPRKMFKYEEDGVVFEMELVKLTAVDEIAAGEVANDLEKEYKEGLWIGDQKFELTPRTWQMIAMVYMMQPPGCQMYSPEELANVFVKLSDTANALVIAANKWGEPSGNLEEEAKKKKAQGPGSSGTALNQDSIPSSP